MDPGILAEIPMPRITWQLFWRTEQVERMTAAVEAPEAVLLRAWKPSFRW